MIPRPDRHYRNFMVDSARWDDFDFRDDDIVISTPPKSGTTWTQMICALLIFQTPDLEAPLTRLSPWLDMAAADLSDVLAQLDAQKHRRFIKTHTPLDGLPYHEQVTYLCTARDPRDAFMSMDNHHKNMRPEFIERMREAMQSSQPDQRPENGPEDAHAPAVESSSTSATSREETLRLQFREWIADDGLPWRDDRPTGAPSVLHHVQSFWRVRHLPNIHLIHYDDLLRDLEGEMRRIAGILGIEIEENRWPELVEAATFDAMKRRASDLAPESDKDMWNDRTRFFHKGSTGQWRDILGEEELALYRTAMKERVEPGLAEWLEDGGLCSSDGETRI